MRIDKVTDVQFEKTVKFRFPGGYETQCTPIYKFMSKDVFEAKEKALKEKLDSEEFESPEKREEAFNKGKLDFMVLGVKGIEDSDGKPLDPGKGLELVKTVTQIYVAIIQAYNEYVSAENLRLKN